MPIITHALSVQQPWAEAILHPGGRRKPLENRYNRRAFDAPPFGVPEDSWLGIHAGQRVHGLAEWCLRLCPEVGDPERWARGALLGACRVVGWRRAEDCRRDPALAPWVVERPVVEDGAAPDGWCLLLDAPIRLPHPIPVRGFLGRFALPAPVEV